MTALAEFQSHVAGIPCLVRVTYVTETVPARLHGHPDTWHPIEYGDADWEICDSRGRPAPWLERKLTLADRRRIDEEVCSYTDQDC